MAHSFFRRYLVLGALAGSLLAPSVFSKTCDEHFDAIAFFDSFAERMPEKLRELPVLRDMVMELSKDPNVPLTFRLRLAKTLDDPNLTVIALTEALSKETDTPMNRGWIVNQEGSSGFEVLADVKLGDTENSRRSLSTPIPSKILVAVGPGSAARPAPSTLQFQVLVHELAHARLDQFMEKRGKWMAERFSRPEVIAAIEKMGKEALQFGDPRIKVKAEKIMPDEWKKPLVYMEKGKPVFTQHFYDLLHERYAREVEAELRESPAFRARFPNLPKIRRGSIGPDTVNGYTISDPRVQPLASVPLYDLLRGKIPQEQATEDTAFTWPPTDKVTQPDEFRLRIFVPDLERAVQKPN